MSTTAARTADESGHAFLFTLAVRNVHRPEVHKRLILFAMLRPYR
jgi:hypothetical protein